MATVLDELVISFVADVVAPALLCRAEIASNVAPGFVACGERLADALAKYPGVSVSPPESIGPAIVWLIESPAADRLLRKRVYLPLTHRHGLLPDWDGPGTKCESHRHV
jgi:hypothetical protein